jgi:hypothetical protein
MWLARAGGGAFALNVPCLRLHGLVEWSDIMLLCSFLVCLLTPIEIGILQEISFDSALFLFLLACDFIALADVWLCFQEIFVEPYQQEVFKAKNRVDKQTNKGDLATAATDSDRPEPGTLRFLLRFLGTNQVQNKFMIFLRCVSASPSFVLPIASALGMHGTSLLSSIPLSSHHSPLTSRLFLPLSHMHKRRISGLAVAAAHGLRVLHRSVL